MKKILVILVIVLCGCSGKEKLPTEHAESNYLIEILDYDMNPMDTIVGDYRKETSSYIQIMDTLGNKFIYYNVPIRITKIKKVP